MSTISSIALSGLRAAEARLTAASSNIANAQSNGRVPGATPQFGDVYTPIDVVQTDTSSNGQPQGVSTSYAARPNGYSLISDPNSPFADANGAVATPNVDIASELASVIVAKYEFIGATRTIRAEQDMIKSAIDTLA